ncbi:MAG: hypothetical protein H0V49_06130 [Nocardioidaceae bacterium]|nr:hypothetical protein [Nocardioidaceae bacterium]
MAERVAHTPGMAAGAVRIRWVAALAGLAPRCRTHPAEAGVRAVAARGIRAGAVAARRNRAARGIGVSPHAAGALEKGHLAVAAPLARSLGDRIVHTP